MIAVVSPVYAAVVVEKQALSRIKKISGKNLHRNWLSIPHVTQHDLADITDMEALRQASEWYAIDLSSACP